MKKSLSARKELFREAINQAELACFDCPKEGDRRPRAAKYMEAYALKEKFGLLTLHEKKVLPGLRLVINHLLSYKAGETEAKHILDVLHGTSGCLQPSADWMRGMHNLRK